MLAARADHGGARAQPGRLERGLQKVALLDRRVEQRQLGGGQRHGQGDAGDAGAGAQIEPAGAGPLAQLRHVEQRERVAEERAHDLLAGAQRGDVAAPPGEHQVRIARQGRGLGLIEAERRGQLVRCSRTRPRRRASAVIPRRRLRRSAATSLSTSSGVVCHEHIQRTTPACSSHV